MWYIKFTARTVVMDAISNYRDQNQFLYQTGTRVIMLCLISTWWNAHHNLTITISDKNRAQQAQVFTRANGKLSKAVDSALEQSARRAIEPHLEVNVSDFFFFLSSLISMSDLHMCWSMLLVMLMKPLWYGYKKLKEGKKDMDSWRLKWILNNIR